MGFMGDRRGEVIEAVLEWLAAAGLGAEPDVAAAGSAPLEVPYTLSDCLNARFFFLQPRADAQAHLPEGIFARDAYDVALGLGIPLPARLLSTGQALGVYDVLDCAETSLGPGRAEFSNVGIFIEPPALTQGTPADEADFDFYNLELAWDHPDWRALVERTLPAAPLPTVDLAWSFADLAEGGLGDGHASVTLDGDVAAEVVFQAVTPSSPGVPLDARARGWHIGPEGALYFDVHQVVDNAAGAVVACVHAPGTPHHAASGGADCLTHHGFMLTAHHQDIEGTLHWLPGARPVTPETTHANHVLFQATPLRPGA